MAESKRVIILRAEMPLSPDIANNLYKSLCHSINEGLLIIPQFLDFIGVYDADGLKIETEDFHDDQNRNT